MHDAEAFVAAHNARQAAATPFFAEEQRLNREFDQKAGEMRARHLAEQQALEDEYNDLKRRVKQQAWTAQEALVQQQQAQAVQQQRDADMRALEKRVDDRKREEAAVAEWRRRNGAA